VGGILPGLVVSLLFYWGTIPLVHAYQKIRAGKLRERIERRHSDRDARRAKAAEGTFSVGDDGKPPAG
jgi:hypothetical protein